MEDIRADSFNALADTYDDVKLNRLPADRLVLNAGIERGQRVLDVACGTGWATLAAAQAVGDAGRVIGIDIAPKMLDLARGKAESAGLTNVEFRQRDAEALDFKDADFNAVICALSIFLFRDITRVLSSWRRVLKSAGTVAFSTYGPGLMMPLSKLFFERLARYDGQAPPAQGLNPTTDTPEKCRELLDRAGFGEMDIKTEQLGFYFIDMADYWKEMSSTVLKFRLRRLAPAALEKFKREHLAEVESLRTDRGIWYDVPIIFSIAKKR